MAKKRPKTWDDVFNRYLDKGMDHADAAYRADKWERQRARWKRLNLNSKSRLKIPEEPMAECQAQAAQREGYLDWHAKSKRWERQGYKQKQCAKCSLWIWPDEENRCPDFSVSDVPKSDGS